MLHFLEIMTYDEAAERTLAELESWASRLVENDEQERQQLAEAVGRQVNGVLRGLRERGTTAADRAAVVDLVARIADQVDLGVLRDCVERRAGDLEPLAAEVVKVIVADPVAMANVVALLPTAANGTLRVTGTTLGAIRMPAEVKASAVFSLLSELDVQAAGQLINELSNLVVDLHEGNLVLGGTEPRLRQVFTRLAENVLDHVDPERAALALVALAEDLEVIAASLGDVAWRNPELLRHAVAAMMSSVHAVMRGLTDLTSRLDQLPDEALDAVAATIDAELEAQTAGRLIHAALALTERVLERHPELPQKAADQLGEVVDLRRLIGVGRRLVGPLVARAGSRDGALGVGPRAVGEAVNAAVRDYGQRLATKPDGLRASLDEALGPVDAELLEGALEQTWRQIGDVLARRPDLVLAAVRPAAPVVLQLLRVSLQGVMERSARLPAILRRKR